MRRWHTTCTLVATHRGTTPSLEVTILQIRVFFHLSDESQAALFRGAPFSSGARVVASGAMRTTWQIASGKMQIAPAVGPGSAA